MQELCALIDASSKLHDSLNVQHNLVLELCCIGPADEWGSQVNLNAPFSAVETSNF
jgi:hypothetical protein